MWRANWRSQSAIGGSPSRHRRGGRREDERQLRSQTKSVPGVASGSGDHGHAGTGPAADTGANKRSSSADDSRQSDADSTPEASDSSEASTESDPEDTPPPTFEAEPAQ